MATITLVATGDSTTSSGFQNSTLFSASVGDWLVVVVAATNSGASGASSVTTINDTDSANTFTIRVEVTQTGGSANDGATLVMATCPVTSALASKRVVTNFSPNTVTKAVQVYLIEPDVGDVLTYITADTTGSLGNATNHSAATVSVASGRVIFGAAAIETNDAITGDSDTSNGSWSAVQTTVADSGTDTTSQSAVSQYKVVSGTGNQSWAASTTSARQSARSYIVLTVAPAAYSLSAALGQYTMSGQVMTPKLGNVPLAALAGSYALTGTVATFINSGLNKSIVAAAGSYAMTGTDATLTHGYKLDATTVGSYALTGTDATLRRALPMVADAGSYNLLGTDATLTKASLVNKVLGVDSGAYTLTGTDATLRIAFKVDATAAGSYALTGSAAALVTAANKVLLADPGSYALVGTDVALTPGIALSSVGPLHIGEWPIDKKKRRAREDAQAKEQRARKRFRDAIGRLLEGLPPEFDEPADLDEAMDNAVQASNLLYAMSAPIREINAVNELIDHIRQLRIAQPIAQLHLAQAYNQAHRHLMAKAQEDVVMALLLGE